MYRMYRMYRRIFAIALCLTLAGFAFVSYAQKGCGGKGEPPCTTGTGCSPGFYKNHPETWVGICCGNAGQRTCADLTTALTCKGSDASCGRSAAAAYLDACTGCSE